MEREGSGLSTECGVAVFDTRTGALVWASDAWRDRVQSLHGVLDYVRWRNRHTEPGQIAIPWQSIELAAIA